MRTMIRATLLCLMTGSALAATPTPVPELCPAIAQPFPSGVNQRPAESYGSEQDYRWMHSSTNLQGYATTEKFAPCLFYNPTDDDLSPQLGGFRSALVVNNPSPTQAAVVTIALFDRNGTPILPNTVLSIPANGHWSQGMTQLSTSSSGVGSARITSNIPVVGASLHYVDSVLIGGTRLTDPHPLRPGANSEQQLQAAQSVGTSLYAGPMPLSNRTNFDFLNGNLPFYCVRNTGTTPTTVTAFKGTSSGIAFPTISATLPGNGLFIDLSVWQAAEPIYLANTSIDENVWALATSDTHPLVGDLILTDFFRYGSPSSPAMSPGKRFRMGSAMMANSPSYGVTSAEVTQQLGPVGPQLDSLIGVLNASTVDIGPVQVTYRNRNGAVVGTNTINSVPAGQTLRLTPGTPGFPASPFFHGWADIRACKPGLIGWTMREVTALASQPGHFEKAYGEELTGANGREPGNFIRVVQSGTAVNRKVAPIARVSPGLAWPSYHNFVNNSTANVGNYWYRFFLRDGTDVTNYAPQPFAGLQFAWTSFTYQDGANSLVNVPFDRDVNARVDVTTGSVIGITAIGDPMREWEIPNYPDPE